MYTQCPECSSAFRVTAEVLRKAGGKVRCGGCHVAFNALLFLSETKPAQAPPPDADEAAVPELRPEPGPADGGTVVLGDESAGESTGDYEQWLAEAGDEEIRFQDTGIEWRLLDNPEDEDEEAHVESELFEGPPESSIDELLEDAPTPVDEFLTETPGDIDAAEVFADDDREASLDAIEVFEAEGDAPGTLALRVAPEDELRFDDNTGLPEDFDFDAPSPPSILQPEPQPASSAPVEEQRLPVDLAFGDPEEWGELLQEVVTAEPDATEPDTTDPDTTDPDATMVPAQESVEEALHAARTDDVDGLPELVEGTADDAGTSDPLAIAAHAESPQPADLPFDLDTQFNLQALSLGIELRGSNDTDEAAADDPESTAPGAVSPLAGEAAPPSENEPTADETAISALALDAAGDQSAANEYLAAETPGAESADVADGLTGDARGVWVSNLDEADAPDTAPPDDDPEAGAAATALQPFPSDTGELQMEIEKARALVDEGAELSLDPEEQIVVPPTEEEQTVNMLIDEDLMRLAIPDEDGMASTIVFDSRTARAADDETDPTAGRDDAVADDAPAEAGFETIIMEGAFARTEAEQRRLAAEREARDREKAEKARKAEQAARQKSASNRVRYTVAAGVAALALLLVGQFVHQSRADLATVPAIGSAIEPVYRAVGAPVTPDWDVKAWRLEVQGDNIGRPLPASAEDTASGEQGADLLTIYSRLSNEANRSLPYPLIGVSLTNRYEEVIGSRVIEPSEYLGGSADATAFVSSGESFEPAIVIDGVSADATGYRLNVCYRTAGDKLRCAIEDFR